LTIMKTSNKILLTFYLAIIAFALSAMTYMRVHTSKAKPLAPIGAVKTETVKIPYLDFLEASEGVITLVQGEPKIEIYAAENILDHLERGFKDGKYYIHQKKEKIHELLEFEVKVYTNDLKKVILYGNTHLNSKSTIQLNSLNIEANNGSMVDLDLNIDFLKLRCTNNSKVELKGSVNEFNSEAHNSSYVDAENLIAKAADISVSNNAYTKIHITEKLTVSLYNSGKISYWGNPEVNTRVVEKAAKLQHKGNPQ